MKRAIFLIFILLAAVPLFSQSFGGGDGTESSPYEIYTKAHLEELANYVNAGNDCHGKYFVQKQDIRDTVTKMIGYYIGETNKRVFRGNYNGNFYLIVLNIENEGIDEYGYHSGSALFPKIRDATLTNIVVSGNVKGVQVVGGIVGSDESVTSIGGITTTSTISGCTNYANIEGEVAVGGIIGAVHNNCVVSDCLNLGTVESGSSEGGIIGNIGEIGSYKGVVNILISNCINAGNIGSDREPIWEIKRTSGIVGILWLRNPGTNSVINCINIGVVKDGKGIANIRY